MYTCSLHLYKIQVCYLCVWTFFLWEKKTFIWPWTSPLTERTRRWDLWWHGWWLPGGCSPRWSVPSAQTCAPGGGGSCTPRTEPGGPFSAGCKQSHYSQIMLERERKRESNLLKQKQFLWIKEKMFQFAGILILLLITTMSDSTIIIWF